MDNSSAAVAVQTRVRLGVSPLSWVNEVLVDFGDGTDPEQCMSEAMTSGFTGVELSRIFPRDASALTRLLRRHRLALVSGWYSGALADRSVNTEIDAVKDHASLLKACGSSVMVYGECGRIPTNPLDTAMSSRHTLDADEWTDYGARLTDFAERLHDEFGLSLAYHHHLMTVVETLDEIRALMKATGPAVGLLLDTGHAFAAGFDYAKLILEYGSRINHIHLKDVRANVLADVRKSDFSFNNAVRAGMFGVPGDGAVDYAPLAKFLAQGSYCGWLVVEAEQDPTQAPPAETVKRAFDFSCKHILKSTL